MRLRS